MSAAVPPQYYDYNRHKLMFDSEDDSTEMRSWEDQLESADIPLVVDMSHWIGCITRCTLPYDLFLDKISDGIVLCNFGNTINAMTGFGARRQISNIMYPDTESEGEGTSPDRHNIASFLQWCKTYGLEREWLFSVSDLADKRDGRRVLRALLWIGRLAHKRGVPAPQIVKIEEKYGMRYYTFMMRIISEPPIPTQILFKDEEEQGKEKRSSRISVTSFFGRRSSRTSVKSNASDLPSITEDRKKSIIGGNPGNTNSNKKDKKKKKKDSAVTPPDETELIAPNNDIQQIYMQIMSLVYHKGFQRAKPKGFQAGAMEDWQAELHATNPSTLPVEEFSTLPKENRSAANSRGNSLSRTSPQPASNKVPATPTANSDFFMSTFSVDPPSKDPLGAKPGQATNVFKAVKENADLDSSSDNAFADDDKKNLKKGSGKKRKTPTSPGVAVNETGNSAEVDPINQYVGGKNKARSDGKGRPPRKARSPDGNLQPVDNKRRSPDDKVRSGSPNDKRRSPDDKVRSGSPNDKRRSPDDRVRSPVDKRRSPDDRIRSGSPNDKRRSPDNNKRSSTPNVTDEQKANNPSLPKETRLEALVHNIFPNSASEEEDVSRERLDEEADNEIRSITDKMRDEESISTSINVNPKIDFDNVDEDISGAKRKATSSRKSHLKSPSSKKEQGIKNSDKVDVMPDTKYGSLRRSPSRQRSFSRQQSRGGGEGISLGQVLLLIVCPCRLCFGGRR